MLYRSDCSNNKYSESLPDPWVDEDSSTTNCISTIGNSCKLVKLDGVWCTCRKMRSSYWHFSLKHCIPVNIFEPLMCLDNTHATLHVKRVIQWTCTVYRDCNMLRNTHNYVNGDPQETTNTCHETWSYEKLTAEAKIEPMKFPAMWYIIYTYYSSCSNKKQEKVAGRPLQNTKCIPMYTYIHLLIYHNSIYCIYICTLLELYFAFFHTCVQQSNIKISITIVFWSKFHYWFR